VRALVPWLLVFAFTACAQTYYYTRKPNADGQGHEALAYWSVTERALWFDESSETIRVTLQCGTTVPFQERQGGVYVLYDPVIWSNPRTVSGAQYCGQVHGTTHVGEITEGHALSLELWCTPVEDDEGFSAPLPRLPPGTYTFDAIARASETPSAKQCELPDHSTR
jgi:hypothetical protein